MIDVVVVDDEELVRAGITALLDSDAQLRAVGAAADGLEAVDLVATCRPAVVLMDIRMPRLDGIEATQRIKAQDSPPAVLMLTTFDTDDHVHDALRAGADGFLVKDTPPARLLDAVKAAADGGVVISPHTAARLRDQMVAAAEPSRLPPADDLRLLTPREIDVLRWVARGLSNSEIAEQLVISPLTAKTHVSRILTKLNLASRVHAVIVAYETGLVAPGEQRLPPGE